MTKLSQFLTFFRIALRVVIFIRNILQYGVQLTKPSRKETSIRWHTLTVITVQQHMSVCCSWAHCVCK